MIDPRTITVIAGTLNALGGGELVTLASLETLKEVFPSSRIFLRTLDTPDMKNLCKIFGDMCLALCGVTWDPLGLVVSKSIHGAVPISIFTSSLLNIFGSRNLLMNFSADTYPIPAHICYVHFPYFAVREYSGLSFRSVIRKATSLELLKLCKIVLTNSSFTKEVICNTSPQLCKKTFILYPPITVKPLDPAHFSQTLHQRKPIVVTISRFSREKKLETLFEVARLTPEAKFVLIGSLRDKAYYKELNEEVKRIGNVEIHPNASASRVLEIMRKSMIYLHTMPYEHFGIAIVEAMSQGLVPVVHRSGGPWRDILECSEGLYGYSYVSPEMASSKIRALINDRTLYMRIALNAIEKSTKFTLEEFKKKFSMLLHRITE
ncbi:MAG: glycosyltransferase [Desulfurococcaceae archaeon]